MENFESSNERERREVELHELNMELQDAARNLASHIDQFNPYSGRQFSDEELEAAGHFSKIIEKDIDADIIKIKELGTKRKELRMELDKDNSL
jgi:uncharacterized protein YaaN involved in tellurite resistance